ncbi:hypothetical protein GCM10007377_15300 [Galliscardovia ingluviei]|uniref:Addiction module killer protein n=1 Tax=Galliscardovia ingluviei TaxID=1769422 RepID=A0A8J3ASD1_9BIFI|nr:type II toxin-antitoxin system RelE/ParE family toxin [Galliscardovia ingluviei]GGI15318.1 hypothetical protein GCM10007377_15300 [Galliscardovia ingluviei]
MEIRTTATFDQWLNTMKNIAAKTRIIAKIQQCQQAGQLFGDIKSVGDNVHEMRFHFGAGYRIYYTQHGNTLVILLAGGDKSTQQRDINNAKQLAQQLSEN